MRGRDYELRWPVDVFRKQLVGLLADDPTLVLTEGAQILDAAPVGATAPMVGHVSSSYMSPTLGRSIAMALVKGGAGRMGERVHVSMQGGRTATATIANKLNKKAAGTATPVPVNAPLALGGLAALIGLAAGLRKRRGRRG